MFDKKFINIKYKFFHVTDISIHLYADSVKVIDYNANCFPEHKNCDFIVHERQICNGLPHQIIL